MEQDNTASEKEQELPIEKPLDSTDSDKVDSNAAVDNTALDNEDPLLSADVKEREHHFQQAQSKEEIAQESTLDELFGGDDEADLKLEPPKLDTQGEQKPSPPDLDKMEIDPSNANTLDAQAPATGISSSASEFGWEIIQKTLPDMVHEVARMEKRDVDKILSKVGARCTTEEAQIIEEINSDFRKGLELSPSHNQMGKAAMRQLFVSKGIEKKITPELMLGIVALLILVSWGLAYKRFRREKQDLFDKLEELVKVQLKAQKQTESQGKEKPSSKD